MRDTLERLRLERRLAFLFFCAILVLAALVHFIRGVPAARVGAEPMAPPAAEVAP